MTQICPRCGTTNDDAVKFCTSCGDPLTPIVRPEMAVHPLPSQGSPAAQPGRTSSSRIVATAAAAVIIILAILLALQVSGIFTVLPSPAPPVTPGKTPVTTLSGTTYPSPPETTRLTVMTTIVQTTTEPPIAGPASTKTVTCPSDRRACGANCTDPLTDPGNCGACGVSCSSSQTCVQGRCTATCPAGQSSCFGGCHNLSYDAENCGICGNSCPGGLVCNNSICSPTLRTTIPTYTG